MELTEELKARIDRMDYSTLLNQWRFAPIGDPMFQGESGDYFTARMVLLRAQPDGDAVHTRASKQIGWGD